MITISTKELADLKSCSAQSVQRMALAGKLNGTLVQGSNGRPAYQFDLRNLAPELQIKYYRQRGLEFPPELRKPKKAQPAKEPKPLDTYTAAQREEISRWITIIQDWQSYRSPRKDKDAADAEYIAQCRANHPDVRISRDILYSRQRAYKANDYDGLIDKRGLWRKGQSSCPEEIRNLFFTFWLAENEPPTSKCYEATRSVLRRQAPELLEQMPSRDTVYRWAREFSKPVAVMARKGDKAFYNRCDMVVQRMYDGMQSNDYWVADGHTMDVVTKPDSTSKQSHRLTLSGIMDVYSGAYIGWTLTDNPCTDSTLYALRKAIVRSGMRTPKNFYVDNGREYLNKDVGGTGHRTKKGQEKEKLPTPVLQRLGINMVNALPANGRAKNIERGWRDITFASLMCASYCGSNSMMRPEKLQEKINSGEIPTDGELIEVINTMIDGYFNQQLYNGPIVANKGKTKWQVYLDNLPKESRAVASVEDLNLLLMRSERLQTVTNQGVHIKVHGTKIWYFNDDLLMNLTGKRVFVRYDPENLDEIRVYDQDEKYVMTVPIRDDMRLRYGDTQEKIKHAAKEQRRYRKAVKEKVKVIQEAAKTQFGHINLLDTFMGDAREALKTIAFPEVPESANVIKMPEPAPERQRAASGDDDGVVIDIQRMIRNREAREARERR